MARRMAEAARRPPPLEADALVPVPLHAVRLRERSFNHAAELADAVGRLTGIPVLHHLLLRTRPTAAQAQLDARARRQNVEHAFAVRGAASSCRSRWQPDSVTLPEASVVLVDDVITTGATVRACAKALKAAGAARVGVLAFAHG